MEKCLTELQAFEAMRKFLEGYYERTSSDDIGSLLGDIQFFSDNSTADPAAWDDWVKCIQKVLSKEKTINKKMP